MVKPLGVDAVKATKKNLGWPEDKTFYVPDEARANWAKAKSKGKKEHEAWTAKFEEYSKTYPEPAAEFDRVINGRMTDGWEEEDSELPNG